MKRWLETVLWTSIALVGCAQQIFPPDVVHGVDHSFDFVRWRSAPRQTEPVKVQLGGRIVDTHTIGGIITIVATELPVVRYPAYGPKEGKSKGNFVITYRGDIKAPFLHPGNRIMVVGMASGTRLVTVNDVMRTLPSIDARCVHIWKTGNTDISEALSSGSGYPVLEEETFCLPH